MPLMSIEDSQNIGSVYWHHQCLCFVHAHGRGKQAGGYLQLRDAGMCRRVWRAKTTVGGGPRAKIRLC